MDIIISANDEIKRMIKEIPLEEDKRVSPENFQNMIISIANGSEKDEV